MPPTKNKFLRGLNERQAAAVRQTEGAVLVLAGAGSGKTRVITNRIAYLLSEGKAQAREILAVTFTNKAAAEMRERVASLTDKRAASEVVISTFHSFCLNILRQQIEHVGYRKNFTIAGEGDSQTLLRRITDELGGGSDGFKPGMFSSMISLSKNNDEIPHADRPAPVKNATEEKYTAHMAEVYEKYQSALRACNSVDFDDLLLLTLKLWREHPRILGAFQKRFKYVMVDEYQDTNKIQYELLRLLVQKSGNFCVVGDDDQSIYGWRGADVRNILDFERDFPKAKIVTLDQNYRSTETILKAANEVIKHNTARRDKNLWSDLGKGRTIDWFVVADEEAEAKETVRWLQHIRQNTNVPWSDFALLYRSNAQSKPLEIAFRQAGIPYVVFGGQEFFDRAEVKDIIAYLKVIANPRDEASFLRVVNMPRRGIGDTTLHKVHDICRDKKVSLGKGLSMLLQQEFLVGDVQATLDGVEDAKCNLTEQGIREFLGLLKHFQKRFRDQDASLRKITEDLILAIKYHDELKRFSRSDEQVFSRWQNVELVLKAIEEYEANAARPTLGGFLDESHLNSDQDRASKEERGKSAVSMMTIHSSKGLEFPFVCLMGVEEGLMPHERSIKENSLDEERRLFYVAITRAKRSLTCFEALTRVKHGNEKDTKTSRFMADIPAELLQQRIRASREMVKAEAEAPKPKQKKKRIPKKRL